MGEPSISSVLQMIIYALFGKKIALISTK